MRWAVRIRLRSLAPLAARYTNLLRSDSAGQYTTPKSQNDDRFQFVAQTLITVEKLILAANRHFEGNL
jgi:hypothetical protein